MPIEPGGGDRCCGERIESICRDCLDFAITLAVVGSAFAKLYHGVLLAIVLVLLGNLSEVMSAAARKRGVDIHRNLRAEAWSRGGQNCSPDRVADCHDGGLWRE